MLLYSIYASHAAGVHAAQLVSRQSRIRTIWTVAWTTAFSATADVFRWTHGQKHPRSVGACIRADQSCSTPDVLGVLNTFTMPHELLYSVNIQQPWIPDPARMHGTGKLMPMSWQAVALLQTFNTPGGQILPTVFACSPTVDTARRKTLTWHPQWSVRRACSQRQYPQVGILPPEYVSWLDGDGCQPCTHAERAPML